MEMPLVLVAKVLVVLCFYPDGVTAPQIYRAVAAPPVTAHLPLGGPREL